MVLSGTENMKKLLKTEIVEITKLVNGRLKSSVKTLDESQNLTKVDIVNQLSSCLADGIILERRTRKTPKKSLKSLQELTSGALMKNDYPKHVLNISYASYIWPKRAQSWRKNSRVTEKVKVVCEADEYFEPYYVPDFDKNTE